MLLLPLAVVLSTMQFEGEVTAAGGDFVDVPFTVPRDTVEIHISHDDGAEDVILDWGVWGPDGFRGWGGGNTEDVIIGIEESSRSYRTGPITPGTWTVVIGKAKLSGGVGRYAITVTCHDDASLQVRARAPHAGVVLSTEARWYKGDFHVHSSESGDANASFDQIAALARSRGLDFVNLSDHNTDSHVALAAAAQAAHPQLLFLRGAEITTYAGHGNAVGLADYVDHRIGYEGRTVAGILDEVAARDALFIVNHPTLELGDNCLGCAWRHDATPWSKVAGLEIITGKWDAVAHVFVPPAIRLWDEQLDAGARIAAIGGSDDHRAGAGTGPFDTPVGSPTTLVYATELSEAAILEGIRRGRTIVQLRGPDDPFVEVSLDGAQIGDEVEGVETARVAVTITGGAGTFVQLWRDGERVGEQVPVASDAFTHTFTDAPGAADRRYRVELIDDTNRRVVVTSHIYVRGVAASGGCGCGAGGADPGGALVLLAVVAALTAARSPSARAGGGRACRRAGGPAGRR